MNLKKLEKHDQELSIRLMRSSPIGPIVIAASLDGLKLISIITEDDFPFFTHKTADVDSARLVDMALSQLVDYFSGKRTDFTIPLYLKNATDFQREVLHETARIPYGQVRTYGQVAIGIRRPQAARAVGGALAHNPIVIVIPCHRVVAHDGRLHGFSSPHGIKTKAALLEHEGILIERERVLQAAV
jgi:methylated-DNA-[protein]-cysteine S-methyltransferase